MRLIDYVPDEVIEQAMEYNSIDDIMNVFLSGVREDLYETEDIRNMFINGLVDYTENMKDHLRKCIVGLCKEENYVSRVMMTEKSCAEISRVIMALQILIGVMKQVAPMPEGTEDNNAEAERSSGECS